MKIRIAKKIHRLPMPTDETKGGEEDDAFFLNICPFFASSVHISELYHQFRACQHFLWDKRLTDQAKRAWDNYKHLHIDLSTARIDQSYDAVAKIKLNRKSNDALDLEKGVKFDIDHDGFDDVIIGARSYNNARGRVYLYWGGQDMDTIADQTFDGEGGFFGCGLDARTGCENV